MNDTRLILLYDKLLMKSLLLKQKNLDVNDSLVSFSVL